MFTPARDPTAVLNAPNRFSMKASWRHTKEFTLVKNRTVVPSVQRRLDSQVT
jgi:hypothetical protein